MELVSKNASFEEMPCQDCPIPQLVQMGIKDANWDYIVALAGNPNTGKSTLFNALTGMRQHTGNWPGKTVTRMEGMTKYDEKVFKLVDLPGTYSLLATSEDEEVARDFILFGQPDVTIVVLDATRLERNLNLAFQVLEITDRVVFALNLMDEAKRHGLEVSARKLSRELGAPVIPTVARSGQGITDLMQAVEDVASGAVRNKPRHVTILDEGFNQAVSELAASLQRLFPDLPNTRWVAIRLLDGDERMTAAVQTGELTELVEAQHIRHPQAAPEAVPA
jgi:ferrous iron transport protein B